MTTNSDAVFARIGVAVHPVGEPLDTFTDDEFNIIKETLSRIGLANVKDKVLMQSCHILHKKGFYKIVHFKEMFLMDGKQATLTPEDVKRRNTIAWLLDEWKLLDVASQTGTLESFDGAKSIFILPHKDKASWTLAPKYRIGAKVGQQKN